MAGTPFNLCGLALMTHLMAACTGRKPGLIVWIGCDTHLYTNHVSEARTQLSRPTHPLPTLQLNNEHQYTDPADFHIDELKIKGYKHEEPIPLPIAA